MSQKCYWAAGQLSLFCPGVPQSCYQASCELIQTFCWFLVCWLLWSRDHIPMVRSCPILASTRLLDKFHRVTWYTVLVCSTRLGTNRELCAHCAVPGPLVCMVCAHCRTRYCLCALVLLPVIDEMVSIWKLLSLPLSYGDCSLVPPSVFSRSLIIILCFFSMSWYQGPQSLDNLKCRQGCSISALERNCEGRVSAYFS